MGKCIAGKLFLLFFAVLLFFGQFGLAQDRVIRLKKGWNLITPSLVLQSKNISGVTAKIPALKGNHPENIKALLRNVIFKNSPNKKVNKIKGGFLQKLQNNAFCNNSIKVTADTGRLFEMAIFKKDSTMPNDNKMLCTEYVNMLYDNKFGNSKTGAAIKPNDIYNFQKLVERPKE